MSSPAAPVLQASPARSARRLGLIVFLYVFSHSYFVVGSLRNALGSGPQDGMARAFALLFGLGWCALLLGGLLLLLKQRGRPVVRAGAAIVAGMYVVRTVTFWSGPGPDLFAALTTLSMPVYALALFIGIPHLDGPSGAMRRRKVTSEAGLLACGALIPWAVLLVLGWTGGTPGAVSLRPILALFMTFWCALPFFVLILTVRSWPLHATGAAVLAGGGTATAIASLYVYGLIWVQGGNIFLLAVLQTVVFASQALGIALAAGIERSCKRTPPAL